MTFKTTVSYLNTQCCVFAFVSDVSKDCIAFIYRVKQSKNSGNMPQDLNPQQHRSENLNPSISYVKNSS